MKKSLTGLQKKQLFEAMNYMNMAEIKKFCSRHRISLSGKKGVVLHRMKHYIMTGELLRPNQLPEKSKAKKAIVYPLKPKTLILQGAYKNDLNTRKFFKKLIGEHFHFTAFGQDWINERWQQGKPPTYQQFAHFWQKEYLLRKKIKANPKKEWAYLNFIQDFQKLYPGVSKKLIGEKWEKYRKTQVEKLFETLDKINK